MSADCYAESIRRLLKSEGGYVNHPSDPGGPTNFGITLGDYRKYVKADASAADIRAMDVEEAKAIYRAKYWGAMRGDELPAGVDYCVFDYAVNSGTGRAPKVLQRVLGIPVTGWMDDATVAAARAREARVLVQAICDERMRFLQGLKTWGVFGKGWSKRVGEVRAAALAMAGRADGVPVRDAPTTCAPGKGVVPVNDAARKGTAGGAIATGGAAAQQSAASGADWIVIALIVVTALALAAAAWAFWRWRQKRQQEAPA
jgi:lysozyme family protein